MKAVGLEKLLGLCIMGTIQILYDQVERRGEKEGGAVPLLLLLQLMLCAPKGICVWCMTGDVLVMASAGIG